MSLTRGTAGPVGEAAPSLVGMLASVGRTLVAASVELISPSLWWVVLLRSVVVLLP